MLIGVLATAAVTGHARGLLYGGGFDQLGRQSLAAVVVGVYAFAVSWLLAKGVDRFLGFRVTRDDELAGLDLLIHDETAYDIAGHTTGVGHRIGQPTAAHVVPGQSSSAKIRP